MTGRRRPAWRPPLAVSIAAVLTAAVLGAASPPLPAAGQAEEQPAPGWVVLDQRPAAGEQCIVCRIQVHEGDIVEVRYKGRTFFVAAKMLAEFEADPAAYFHQLEAHGGLFDEAAVDVPPMRTGWLVLGLYILAGLVAGAACAYVALDRGLPAWGWFFAGLVANVLAVAAVFIPGRGARPARPAGAVTTRRGLTKIPFTHSPLACDRCGEANHPAAAACASCGVALEPALEPETARA